MKVSTASTAYTQTTNSENTIKKSKTSSASQTASAQGQASSTSGQITLSGKAIMLSRLFGDSNSEPSVQTQLTQATMSLPSTHFLTRSDRDMLSELYSEAQQQGVDLNYVDDLASDLGNYRMFGGVMANVNDGGMYDVNGHAQRFHFTDSDDATGTRILTGQGISSTGLDQGFLRYQLDPGFSFNHRTDFAFLEQVVNKFGSGALEAGQSIDAKFSTYTHQGKDNFVIETSNDVVLAVEEPDVRSVDGVFIITDTGRKNGFEMVNGEPVQRLVEGTHSIIDILRAAKTSETSILRWWQNFLQ
ncbi:hypothetical protein LOZ86_03825 [Pectobacterium parvum]|uniref:Uncharacterized protein n=1 Tax=Pectobacterium parvum TaxID=2778550 RepID=A0AAP9IGQ4_9GAMM|nr:MULTISPECIES: hypothetical protein [Pectobacterium]GKW43725.1 hypothetical protein PEC301879_35830 [Pectobacterium carotovorum subsp. carotovorum]KFX10692.1 hypothetical protein KP17_17970 [Pectobacterium parvum]MCU1803524.1 hypothetical protein [Pectobacterium parvum]QHQ24392.1 hypothetical protein GMX10_10170 [Pectobacterium parvum]UFK40018.1 hypothetical protein LOZ86_03825 [Pectobacterium parvum]